MSHSTKGRSADKPTKPYPDFPLFPHATRRWAKKIRGKLHYFGPWSDPDGALQRYLDQKDDLYAGRTPRVSGDGLTVRDLLNRFLTAKKMLLDAGELAPRSFSDYHATCERIATAFGLSRLVVDLAADDFERLRADITRTCGPVRLGNEIQRVRAAFKYAYDAGLIDRPVRFGPLFKKPSRKVLRRLRASNGPRMFEAAEIRRMLEAASQPLKAMIYLAINCGFGNADCATLPMHALDLKGGWANYPRPKTGIQRRCPLWPESVRAIQAALAERPKPRAPEHEGLVFLTKYGVSWAKKTADNPITKETVKLLKKLGFHRRGVGFYALRHTFATIGGEAKDQVAVDFVMGHSRDDMARVYRESISDSRLRAVVDHVWTWLFG